MPPAMYFPRKKFQCEPINDRVDYVKNLKCLLCGGETCKRCGPSAYRELEEPALDGIHSSWITDYIIGMQRPLECMVYESGLVQQFQRNRIRAIFNLTEIGEHPFCGCSHLTRSGFSYEPQHFMDKGINHFNFSWKDMTIPSLRLMMDIVHVAVNEIWKGGRIAVHCHAGFGRTGTAVACILIAVDELSAKEAIILVRQRRPGSIQTVEQTKFIYEFESFYRMSLAVFPHVSDYYSLKRNKSLQQSIKDQFYSLGITDLSSWTLRSTAKVLVCIRLGFAKYLKRIDTRDGSGRRLRSMISLNLLGLKSNLTSDRQSSKDHYAIDESMNVIEPSFYNDILDQINRNNWTFLFMLVDIMNGITDIAPTIKLISEDCKVSDDVIKSCAVFVLGQLIFLYFETRDDELFDNMVIKKLRSIWFLSEDQSMKSFARNNDDPYFNDEIKTITTYHDSTLSCASSERPSVRCRLESYRIVPVRDHEELEQLNLPIIVSARTISSSVPNPKPSKPLMNRHLDGGTTLDLIISEIERLPKTHQCHIDSLLMIIRMLQSAPSSPTNPFPTYLRPCDIVTLRIAICCVKGATKCPSLVVNRFVCCDIIHQYHDDNDIFCRALSPDAFDYFMNVYESKGSNQFVNSCHQSKPENYDHDIVISIAIVWKTLTVLAYSDWRVSSPYSKPTDKSLYRSANS